MQGGDCVIAFLCAEQGSRTRILPAAGLGPAKYWLVSSPGDKGDDVRGDPFIGL